MCGKCKALSLPGPLSYQTKLSLYDKREIDRKKKRLNKITAFFTSYPISITNILYRLRIIMIMENICYYDQGRWTGNVLRK